MVRDIENDPPEFTSHDVLVDQLEVEVDCIVAPGYSEQQRFIDIRPISLDYCQLYTPEEYKPFIPYLAMTYHDRFLSRYIDIPVLKQGEGFEPNLQLFVFSCVSIACREYDREDFDFLGLMDPHNLEDESDVRKMEFIIKQGLQWKLTMRATTLNPLQGLISLLEIEDQQQKDLSVIVSVTLLAINKDIEFTEFRPSTLTASMILVACYKIYPKLLFKQFKRKIYRSGYVLQIEVEECFDELKDHFRVDDIFCPENVSRFIKILMYHWKN